MTLARRLPSLDHIHNVGHFPGRNLGNDARANALQCPQPAKADIGTLEAWSRFDVVDGARSRRRIAVR
jgi:hypothetical protein